MTVPQTSYAAFVDAKAFTAPPVGREAAALHEQLFDWQRAIVRWALKRGRAALFEDCGLGKTFQQLEWARHVPGRVLILTPLAVAQQTVAEGARFGIEAVYARDPSPAQIVVTAVDADGGYVWLCRDKFNCYDDTGYGYHDSSHIHAGPRWRWYFSRRWWQWRRSLDEAMTAARDWLTATENAQIQCDAAREIEQLVREL